MAKEVGGPYPRSLMKMEVVGELRKDALVLVECSENSNFDVLNVLVPMNMNYGGQVKECGEVGYSMDVVGGRDVRDGAGGDVGCGEEHDVDWADCVLKIVVSHNYACRSCQGVTVVASVVEGIDPSVYCREMYSRSKEMDDK